MYETRFSRFSPFPVNGLATFYHCSDVVTQHRCMYSSTWHHSTFSERVVNWRVALSQQQCNIAL